MTRVLLVLVTGYIAATVSNASLRHHPVVSLITLLVAVVIIGRIMTE